LEFGENNMILPPQILRLALEEIRFTLGIRDFTYDKWFGDAWITLTPEYELNFYRDDYEGRDCLMATIYPKTNGVIDVQHWWKVFQFQPQLEG
jgi:hypothetical protein